MSSTAIDRIHQARHAELCVQQNGIAFHNLAPDQVLIEVEVENRGSARSEPAELRLEAAPLGAFVRWQPLTRIRVPSIAPGRSDWVRTIVTQPRPKPIGSLLDGLRPDLGEGASARENHGIRKPEPLDPVALRALLFGAAIRPAGLPPDLFDLLDGPRPHWAGNLNVWIARRPVERHMAPRLRIHPDRANVAVFCLGDRPDEYAFRTECSDGEWKRVLLDMRTGATLACTGDAYREPRWHAVPGTTPILLVLRPPSICERGKVDVHVTQRSSGKVAMVEFDLDPRAAGPGCFAL